METKVLTVRKSRKTFRLVATLAFVIVTAFAVWAGIALAPALAHKPMGPVLAKLSAPLPACPGTKFVNQKNGDQTVSPYTVAPGIDRYSLAFSTTVFLDCSENPTILPDEIANFYKTRLEDLDGVLHNGGYIYQGPEQVPVANNMGQFASSAFTPVGSGAQRWWVYGNATTQSLLIDCCMWDLDGLSEEKEVRHSATTMASGTRRIAMVSIILKENGFSDNAFKKQPRR